MTNNSSMDRLVEVPPMIEVARSVRAFPGTGRAPQKNVSRLNSRTVTKLRVNSP